MTSSATGVTIASEAKSELIYCETLEDNSPASYASLVFESTISRPLQLIYADDLALRDVTSSPT